VDLNETHLARVELGQDAAVEVSAAPGRRFPAKVVRIDPVADRSKGAVSVRVRLTEGGEGLRPQLSARVTFLPAPIGAGSPAAALRVDRAAIADRGGAPAVFAVAEGRASRRPVLLGEAAGAAVEVRSGILGNEVLVLNPPPDLADGARVEVQP
jgi:multidrug efflux pump subunit AcrA (membrane-fusion protein)